MEKRKKQLRKIGKKLKVEIYMDIRNSTMFESKYVLPLHCTLISLAPGVVKPLPDFQYFQVYF